jgi:glyoxylase-like metal-dependent hydrolase (beta-lactamase superfamily II)
MDGNLIHEVLPVGLLQCNCSILGDAATGDAIVVDPGDEVERILEIIRRHNLKVRAIVSTHTHIDHVGGLATLHKATGAPVMVHQADLPLYANLEMQAEWLGVPTPAMMRIQDFLTEGDTVRWGGFAARVLHTPGHTPGSISLLVEPGVAAVEDSDVAHDARSARRLLAGDTLFRGSIGRTDLPGGSFPQIISSIREKLLVLPEDMIVYPGHGDVTTIGFERERNPFLV